MLSYGFCFEAKSTKSIKHYVFKATFYFLNVNRNRDPDVEVF